MFGYASDETADCMPLTHLIATRLGKKLTDVRKDGSCWWLRPDGKTQVTIEYLQLADGSVEPKKLHTVVISTQHAEPLKAKRTVEQPGTDFRGKYEGPEMIAPSMEAMNEAIHDQVILATLNEITLKNGKPATSIYDKSVCNLHINPSGKFIIGGPQGDAGLTGRKIIIDTYGGWGAHGGGAFSGKDPTKVDRSAAYACRWMAKSVVKAGLCKRALVQLSSADRADSRVRRVAETARRRRGRGDARRGGDADRTLRSRRFRGGDAERPRRSRRRRGGDAERPRRLRRGASAETTRRGGRDAGRGRGDASVADPRRTPSRRYAIGVAKPLSLFVETYGTENGKLTAKAITDIVKLKFDARPGALARDLDLRQPKYNVTAAYCHFGRQPYTENGIRYFAWEDPIDLSSYAGMTTAQIEKEVAANKAAILAKWVD